MECRRFCLSVFPEKVKDERLTSPETLERKPVLSLGDIFDGVL